MPGWRKSLALCLQRMQEDGGLELDDLYRSFQPKPFYNNNARNVCTVRILIWQTNLQTPFRDGLEASLITVGRKGQL
ncbi:hypothetical protein HGM15179_005192, partial [Zosterops borbonicus]